MSESSTAAVGHDQSTGLGGVALGVVGYALLFASHGDPSMAMLSGFSFGAGSILIGLEVLADA